MAHKLVYVDGNTGREWDEAHSRFNDAPSGWREIDEKYLAQHTLFGNYTPEYMDYKQITRVDGKDIGRFIPVHLFYYWDGTGVAVEVDYWGYKSEWVGEGKNKKYVQIPTPHLRWYAFGCEHSYQDYEVPAGNRSGIHKAKCTKCGQKWEYDTSD